MSTHLPSRRRGSSRRPDEQAALFVRIPSEQARRLDRAALQLRVPKQSLVSELLERYVDPDSPESLAALDAGRRVTIETLENPNIAVGHHSFRPREPEVLTPEEAADLLQVDLQLVLDLARSGELPGRELGGHWRFSRSGLLEWLARPRSEGTVG
jgi:excisionase family DNA binding protein